MNLSGLDRGIEALGYIEKSLSIFKNQSNFWGQASACDLHHFIHLKAGRINQAEHCLLKCIIGLMDTMARNFVPEDMILFSMPTNRFVEMANNIEGSFLDKNFKNPTGF